MLGSRDEPQVPIPNKKQFTIASHAPFNCAQEMNQAMAIWIDGSEKSCFEGCWKLWSEDKLAGVNVSEGSLLE